MNRHSLYKLIRFGINGIVMTIGTYVLIRICLIVGMGYIESSVISYVIMLFVNYLISSKFVFKSKKSFKNLIHFFVSQGIAFLLFNGTNYILFQYGLDKNYCFLIAIIFSTTMNFLYNNFITFRKQGAG